LLSLDFFFSLVFLFGSIFNYSFAPVPNPEWHTAPYVFSYFLYVAIGFYLVEPLKIVNYYLFKFTGLLFSIGLFFWMWLVLNPIIELTDIIVNMVSES